MGRKRADGLRITEPLDGDGEENDRDSNSLRSWGKVRGYVARSSWGANWAGFTKMDKTVRSFSAKDRLADDLRTK